MDRNAIRILVVDDEFSIVESLREILTWEGFQVETASNGRLGLEALAKHPPPDLILLDVMMPILDGLAFLAALRATDPGRKVPVILMSAAPLRVTPEQADYQAFLRKPFDVGALIKLIDKVLKSGAAT